MPKTARRPGVCRALAGVAIAAVFAGSGCADREQPSPSLHGAAAQGDLESAAPLYRASGAGRAEVVEQLLARGADVRRKERAGWTRFWLPW